MHATDTNAENLIRGLTYSTETPQRSKQRELLTPFHDTDKATKPNVVLISW